MRRPAADEKAWGGRLPRVESTELDPEQQAAAAQLRDWADSFGFAATDAAGGLIGPFIATVLRPRPGLAFQQWVASDYHGSCLSRATREVAILTVGAHWKCDYETYAHVVFARSVGLSEATIRSLLAGNTDALEGTHELTHRFTTELLTTHRISDATYDQALHAFGRDGVIDLVHLVAMYVAQAVMLNAFDTPAPRLDLQA
ncbi:carboxymuconolactone decarboxylase family protein [Streptomyces sp. B3I8]|jgi:4-carboxymuconolactone decarboxylase|uniref:carboxymuconolactone decarboxylase family protein n=1 Tax=Streptomyces sp. B3I8 TaxID=3042303 RepID=UPI0027839C8D|nr:carboxymuconolactone decarboxylase family protein [Streptomyces sp. B3I8]MDQ0784753.1 4-carboxymuconolactone decarboxylase [Streptomyces sp. B3I8]